MTFYTPDQDIGGLRYREDDQACLPHVLLLGDSISIGYTEPVRQALRGTCTVHRPNANCGDTISGLANIEAWVGDRIWDLVHFNWGLHDLCYRHPEATVYGNRDKVHGKISVEPVAYKSNLEKLVRAIGHKAKRLVWASTTYIPDAEAGRHQGDEVRYNAIANEVMEKNGIPTDDLYALTQGLPSEMFTCPGDVHYTRDGYHRIAKTVAQCVRSQLTKRCSATR